MKISEAAISQLITFVKILACLLVARVTTSVVINNQHYFPPDFDSDFLSGRQHYFFGHYQYAFFSHIISGPLSLILGLALINSSVRRRWPKAHRVIGRLQIANVVLIVAPGGFVMALRADGGTPAVAGFAVLAVLTAVTAVLGFIAAAQRKFGAHQRWMFRCFLLLTSAVILRLIAGVSIMAHMESKWIYPVSAWISWVVPVAVYEYLQRNQQRLTTNPASTIQQ